MNIKHNLFHTTLVLIGLAISQAVTASCNRSDIDHYLEKGFSPKQITQLCADSNINSSKHTSSTHVDLTNKPKKNGISFLESAIAVAELKFYDDKFSYITRECIDYDSLSLRRTIGGKRYCGFIRTTVAYQDLNIEKSAFNFSATKLFDKQSVIANGLIQKEILDHEKLNRMTKHEKELLTNTLSSMKKSSIPIQNNIPLAHVRKELRKLAK